MICSRLSGRGTQRFEKRERNTKTALSGAERDIRLHMAVIVRAAALLQSEAFSQCRRCFCCFCVKFAVSGFDRVQSAFFCLREKFRKPRRIQIQERMREHRRAANLLNKGDRLKRAGTGRRRIKAPAFVQQSREGFLPVADIALLLQEPRDMRAVKGIRIRSGSFRFLAGDVVSRRPQPFDQQFVAALFAAVQPCRILPGLRPCALRQKQPDDVQPVPP